MTNGVSVLRHRWTWPNGLRIAITMIILYAGVVGANVFMDLRTSAGVGLSAGGNFVTQSLFITMATLSAVVIYTVRFPLRSMLWQPATLALGCWLLVNLLTSVDPGATLRRVVTIGISVVGANAVIAVNQTQRQFALGLGLFASLVLVVSWLGVLVVPELTTHSLYDLVEPEHDGSWRGIFEHKNSAGAASVIFLFAGWFLVRSGERSFGLALMLLSSLFLIFSRAKSPMSLLPLVLLQSWLYPRLRGSLPRAVLLLGPVAVIGLVTLGPVILPSLTSLTAAIVPDPTFTGRTAIWSFAFENVARRPITGFGLGAFWGTSAVVYGGGDSSGWTNLAGDAHNGYVNAAVELGIPGLILTLCWLVLAPFAALLRLATPLSSEPIFVFCLQVWLFGIQHAMFEGVFYEPSGMFFPLLIAVMTLRSLTLFRLRS